MNQKLFESIRVFLIERKKCTDVESEVSLDGGKADVVGGRFILSEKKASPNSIDWTFGHYIELELHIIEVKEKNDDVLRGIGQLLWYKFLLEKYWCDRLFLYLLVERDRLANKEIEFLQKIGIGVIEMTITEDNNFLINETYPAQMFSCWKTSTEISKKVPYDKFFYHPIFKRLFKNRDTSLAPICKKLRELYPDKEFKGFCLSLFSKMSYSS